MHFCFSKIRLLVLIFTCSWWCAYFQESMPILLLVLSSVRPISYTIRSLEFNVISSVAVLTEIEIFTRPANEGVIAQSSVPRAARNLSVRYRLVTACNPRPVCGRRVRTKKQRQKSIAYCRTRTSN